MYDQWFIERTDYANVKLKLKGNLSKGETEIVHNLITLLHRLKYHL